MSSLSNNLKDAFNRHRVVFWYDNREESREQFDEVNIEGVEKVVMDWNAFAMKYRILKQEPKQKFLLYFPYKRPENSENWLLDIELSNFVFDTEQSALYLQEMNLDYAYKELVQQHILFFGAKERRQKFVALFNSTDSVRVLKFKMLSVVLNTDNYDLQTLVQVYANHYFISLEKLNKSLENYQLRNFIWSEISDKYRYEGKGQNIYEFIIEVFENSFPLTKKTGLTADARLILSSWRDSFTMRESYQKISAEIAEILKIEELLQDAELEDIVEDELFELTDQKIIFELVHRLLERNISYNRFQNIIKTRQSKFWYATYKHLYRALDNAYLLFEQIDACRTDYGEAEVAIKRYVEEEYKIDFYYRKFYEHFHQSNKQNIIKHLLERVEKQYVNKWLFEGGNAYQKLLNNKEKWSFDGMQMQHDFFDLKVKPILERQKIVVIISDALRYECGVELASEINMISKFDASLEVMMGMIPSYTQLGMASLLPHHSLSFANESDSVLVDGLSSMGAENREKILQYNTQRTAKTLKAQEFLLMKSVERRELVRDYEIIYIYSNKIDKTGDDRVTEGEVFDASRQEIDQLKNMVVAATNANASRVLVTSDHGFIYQDSLVDESDFVETKFKGETYKENRRFVLGSKLVKDDAAMFFKANDLMIDSDLEVLIAKGINRFRVKGAGSRFVHGGASLQETIIPLLDISKGREETVKPVEIDIIQSHNRITTNSLPVEFVQQEPVSEKVLPVEIKAFIQAKDGKVLSDLFTFIFDFTGDEHRQRSKRFVFHMVSDAANSYRNQMVDLVLQTPIENTSRWKDYKRFGYNLNISFTSDFD
ncbi:MAG TPA: BREX-1 system phosphatase PglZ type A [Dysgonamonadaceae bacterium]|nr:BREX-1 system phosphatase PglZ type A [Dysgonamonadaceae bacterium]